MRPRAKNTEKILSETLGLFDEAANAEAESARAQTLAYLNSHTDDVGQERVWEADDVRSAPRPQLLRFAAIVAGMALVVLIPVTFFHRAPAVFEDAAGSRRISFGEVVRANDSTSTLVLADTSRVEMRANSELSLERADDGVRIRLRSGDIIVNAAKQHGHFYVQTKDVTVSVVGTVFLVKAEAEGSRVAVIEGEVHVQQGTTETKLQPGEQVTSNPKMESHSVKEEIAWSSQAVTHVALLQQAKSPTPKEALLAFELATVRPAAALSAPGVGARGGGDGNGRPGGSCVKGTQLDPSRLRVIRAPLFEIVAYAYGDCRDMVGDPLNIIRPFPRLSSVGPGWIKSDPWDIEALIPEGSLGQLGTVVPGERAAGFTLNGSPVQKMLQTLLQERFKLVVRREMKEMPVYVLRVGPNGTKFQGKNFNYGNGTVITADMIPPGGDRFSVTPATAADGATIARIGAGPCVGVQSSPLPDRCNDGTYTNISMDEVATHMSGIAGKLILNRTGIQGKVSFLFELPRLQYIGNVPQYISFQGFAKGLESVGLKLTEDRAPVEFFVIEGAERPLEN